MDEYHEDEDCCPGVEIRMKRGEARSITASTGGTEQGVYEKLRDAETERTASLHNGMMIGSSFTGIGGLLRWGVVKLGARRAAAKVLANRANHIFGPKSLTKHNLGGFLNSFSGNKIKAFKAIQSATQKMANNGNINGVFETVVQINNTSITVRGKVIDGAAKIGTAFIP